MPEADFREVQRRFAAHLRDPERNAPPEGVEERRMAIYRRLFLNNVEDLLGRAYPVLGGLHGPERWSRLVRDFYREHGCHTPYFPRLAEEFLDYLNEERGQRQGDFPFLAELAHYERAEVVVAQHDEGPEGPAAGSIDPAGDPMSGVPVLSGASRLLAYEYPVHRIGPDFLPETPGEHPTYLVVFRDREWRTRFIELNALSARILWYVEHEPAAGAELVLRVAVDFGLPADEPLHRSAAELLRHWLQRGVLAGVRAPS